ncbi:hypothetical protein ACLOJK_002932 [Asimina triloba]
MLSKREVTLKGLPQESHRLYLDLQNKKVKPDKMVLLSIAKACPRTSDPIKAKEVHEDAIRFGFSSDIVLGNALIHMYAKCNSVHGAVEVFDQLPTKDVISWTSIDVGHLSCGLPREALQAFREMGLNGLRNLKALNSGKEIHGFVVKNGMIKNVFVNSGLVDRDVVSWNVIMTTYFSNGDWGEALTLIDQMTAEGTKANLASWNTVSGGFKANEITIAGVLQACTNLESLGGETSRRFFAKMTQKDTVAWNTTILANSMHGHGLEAMSIFHQMRDSGIKPNVVTFMAVLSRCSHSQLIDEGLLIFNSIRNYNIEPDEDHYSCMVDVLSCAGRLEEANKFIQEMPLKPTAGA